MLKLGLVGRDISHSKSKQMYEELLKEEIDYSLFDYSNESEIPKLEYFFDKVEGLSITAPYKKHFTDEVTILGDVKDLNIINCIRRKGDSFEATNTDYLAVDDYFKKIDSIKERQVILLGSGSMAEITIHSAQNNNIDLIQYSRSQTTNFSDLDLVKIEKEYGKKLFVINSCSREFEYKGPISEDLVFWDYNYGHNFHFNRFTQSNTQYIDGIDLLKNQAAFALKFWDITN